MLSSLDGAAENSIKINGVLHEFSTIPGIHEDVTDIILNLKQLCIKVEEEAQLLLEVHFDFLCMGCGILTAADFIAVQFPPILVVHSNPELVIATMDETAYPMNMGLQSNEVKWLMFLQRRMPTSLLVVFQSIPSSPILRAKYEVSDVRVGNEWTSTNLH